MVRDGRTCLVPRRKPTIKGYDSELNMAAGYTNRLDNLAVPPQIANLTDEERARMLVPPEE
jgi:hypothetical protein